MAGVLFLVALLAGETDEAFADMYSGAVSLQNIAPKLSQRLLTLVIAIISVLLAGRLTMERYETFLFLIGSVFVPLFGIMIADHFVSRRGLMDPEDLYRRGGRYWYAGGVRIAALVPWVTGFAVYHWVSPIGPDAWVAWVNGLVGTPLGYEQGWLAASLPSFAISFLLWATISYKHL